MTGTCHSLTETGPGIPVRQGRPGIVLLNANPFAEGIANLGAQVIASALIEHEFNVCFGFADTVSGGHLIAADDDVDYQVVAVSVPFEDTYHHVPRMLRDIGLPVWAEHRPQDAPIVVAGGLALINPMPLSPFFDAMVIGEGREAMVAAAELVAAGRANGRSRAEIVAGLAAVPHIYVPSLYRFEYDENGSVTGLERDSGAPDKIFPGRPLDMEKHPIHSIWTSERACYKYPDYYSVMVAMGCHLKCPFCVVGNVQGNEGGRAATTTVETITRLAEERRARYGTRLVKLFFASSFSSQVDIDPLNLRNLIGEMLRRGFECRVGSLNIKQADDELLRVVRAAGQERVTFAPETGRTLRQSIGKPYSRDDKLIYVAERAGKLGMGLDIYTMIGVPGEEPRHVRELARLIADVRAALDRRQTLEVSLNPAFSKAQTPYERRGAVRPEEARARFAYLRKHLPGEDGTEWVTVIDDPMTYYQPILALGGPELAAVLDRVSHEFSPAEDTWRRVVAEEVPGGDRRYFRDRSQREVLAWEHIEYNSHPKLALRLDAHRQRAARVPASVGSDG
jgi:radical SAM superfamily enzyme YgiQ (UPF0313 family)